MFTVTEQGTDVECFTQEPAYNKVRAVFKPNSVLGETNIELSQSMPSEDLILLDGCKLNGDFVTNILHLSPHRSDFLEPVQVEIFYCSKYGSPDMMQVLYSDTSINEDFKWKVLSQNGAKDELKYKLEDDRCTLWFSHFCAVTIITTRNGSEFKRTIRTAALGMKYFVKSKRLEVTVSFHLPRTNDDYDDDDDDNLGDRKRRRRRNRQRRDGLHHDVIQAFLKIKIPAK